MARGEIDLRITGIGGALDMLGGVEHRLDHLDEAQEPIDEALNAEYRKRFSAWNGYLVDTGALRESLTDDSANGALRQSAR
jgi:hypothetical protein